ncbi:glycosyltransferase [Candidatus Nitrosotenuis cloacae]|uniref:glycosyltransferase n=1 Tax=Candidatus Nitrosotenuis cloacae TaxID=1603555 RepID=UPI002280D954|nr:glycosyltransferase [Candidatus Nitrosotenuis cloacae]
MNRTEIAFFCSPIGLGHATRDVAVAHLFDLPTRFVSGAGAARMISECGFSVENLYNPPRFDVQNGELKKSARWLWQYYQYYKECKKESEKFIKKEDPRLVVSDEDFASLGVAQGKKISTILITDILETRFTKGVSSIIEKKMNQSMRNMIQKCDAVIVPETGEDVGNIRRVGPIVRTTNLTRDELRERFAFAKKTVTVTVGGTDAGRFLIEKALEVSEKMRDVEFVLVSGPSLKIEGRNVRNMGYVSNLHEVIYASDVVLSLAGKSTIDESKAYGTPGIFIPIKNHFEQEDNAKSEGYTYDDISRLEQLVSEKLQEKRNPLASNGARKAFEIIKQYMSANP